MVLDILMIHTLNKNTVNLNSNVTSSANKDIIAEQIS